jgi:hypothetical protein
MTHQLNLSKLNIKNKGKIYEDGNTCLSYLSVRLLLFYKYFFVLLRERIIEYRMNIINVGPLARLSVEKFVLSVGARTSAPGGGSVAALLAGLVCCFRA